MYNKIYKKIAFTLAEVLITLGIIGVVAAMTIPTLMNATQNAEFKTAYKKAFSVASQALELCVADDTLSERTGWLDVADNTANFNAFKAKFNVTKYCDGSTTPTSECWDMTGEKFNTSSAPAGTMPSFVDNSGMVWVQGNSFGAITGDVLVDTNGAKKPNKFGKDRFRLKFVTSGTSVEAADLSIPGLPSAVIPDIDFTSNDATYCPSAPCYYSSWLYNKN